MDDTYYQRLEAERRSEKCRACSNFEPIDITCKYRNGWRLSKAERLAGCPNFKADLWGGRA